MSIPNSSNGTASARRNPPQNSSKRISELKEVEDGIAQLLHFAGCTIASLHPDPLTSFTSRTTSFAENDSDDDQDSAAIKNDALGEPEEKGEQFTKYAEAYYNTLNEIQLSLRSSIRHLRVSLASPAPLIDPTFGSVANLAGGIIASGGVAFEDRIKPLPLRNDTVLSASSVDNSADRDTTSSSLSVQALKLEKEAWKDLAAALDDEAMVE